MSATLVCQMEKDLSIKTNNTCLNTTKNDLNKVMLVLMIVLSLLIKKLLEQMVFVCIGCALAL